MTARTCPITGHELGRDRFAAPAAAGRLRATLANLPDLMADLEVTITRQLRMSGNSAAADDRLPFNPEASESAWVLRQTLLVWVDELARLRGEGTPDTWPRVRDALVAWSDWMTTVERGVQAIDEILDAHHQALRAIDRPADRTYAGPCPTCHGDVYGRPGTDAVKCTTCSTEFDHADARDAMLERLAVMHLPAADAARAASILAAIPVTAAQVRKWKHRGQLTPSSVNVQGQPLYDLIDLVALVTDRQVRVGA